VSQWGPISKLAADVQAGKVKASELVERALKTIDEKSEYSAILAKMGERSRKRAKEIDQRIAKGEKVGRLAGVPFIAKDNILVFGETTAGSNILKGFDAPYQATAIERLEDAGAICVAKANLDAFGHGASTENSDFVVTRNPHDKTRVPGGSSGGSAAAVVLEMAPFALGTDTGGSTRQPASLSGCVGYKPTYGLISRSGIVAMTSSTDTVGTLARTVEDAALAVDVMAGKDELDGTTIERDKTPYTDLSQSLKGQKVGVLKEYMGEGLDPAVKKQIEQAVEKMRQAGADVKEVSLPSIPLSLAVYYIVIPAEISSNLSRYDGQRYGFSHPKAKTLDESYNWSRSEGFGNEAKRRIMIGTYVLSSGYYDAYYRKAQQLRTKLVEEFDKVFSQVDFIVGPATPTTAFKVGENAADPLQMYLQDVYTVGPSLVGIPAIVVPAGRVDGLPVGLQIMAPQRKDRELLGIAQKTEEILGP
jgi:aspartyl-tRNA(Asn)/glutamyl-tRNA(Gln) amidotransferase subunit A